MISLKYDCKIETETFVNTLNRLINQCYKILCYREEYKEWEKPLKTIILEIVGLQRLIDKDIFLTLISKLESLFTLAKEEDFFDFRRTAFDCLGILDEVKNNARFYESE